MKAQIITEFGDPTVFKLKEIEKPTIKPGHVLIKVYATSVNQIDCKIRSGAVPALAPEFPAVLQGDVAGVIEEVAADVKQFQKGDEVYGCAGGVKGLGGALAEYMLADSSLIAKKPQSLTMEQTAALPLVSITAWEALFDKAKLQAGSDVLIHGGVGGVGHVAIQLAKWANADVFTTVLKEEDFNIVKSFGIHNIINAKQEDVEHYVQRLTQGSGFDVVFDTVGGVNLDRSLQATKYNGHIVTTAARSTHDLTPMHNKGLSLHVVFMLLPLLSGNDREHHGKILTEIAKIVDQGKLKPLVDDKHFTLESAAEAHRWLESGKAQGKVVISIIK